MTMSHLGYKVNTFPVMKSLPLLTFNKNIHKLIERWSALKQKLFQRFFIRGFTSIVRLIRIFVIARYRVPLSRK